MSVSCIIRGAGGAGQEAGGEWERPPSLAVNRQPSTVNRQLSTVNCQPSTMTIERVRVEIRGKYRRIFVCGVIDLKPLNERGYRK